MFSIALEQVLRAPQVWRARDIAPVRSCSTRFDQLDALLPGHGWPFKSLIELIPLLEGIGELSLLVPALKNICREGRDIVFIRPPHSPYPPALAQAGLPLNRIVLIQPATDRDARWAAEQTLREGTAGAVLLWSDTSKEMALRRLQLAAHEGDTLAFLYRPIEQLKNYSPAAVRLALRPCAGALHIEVLKARGGQCASTALQFHRSA